MMITNIKNASGFVLICYAEIWYNFQESYGEYDELLYDNYKQKRLYY